MPTERKAQTIAGLSGAFRRANLIILTDYRGLKVSDLQTLRSSLRNVEGEFQVAKNTLARIAADQAGIEGLTPLLEGPLGLAFAYGDTVPVAKAISDFARTSRILSIRGGVMDKKIIGASDVDALATMPSQEVLQSMFLGLLQSPMRRTVTVLNGPPQSLAYLLSARAGQMDGDTVTAAAD